MLIDRKKLDEAYTIIKQEAETQRSKSVVVFVSLEVDALCAFKVLTALMRSDAIEWQAFPVAGYAELKKANDTFMQGNEDIKSVIMINCGGSVDLKEFFSLDESVSIYVLDSHRPYHLHNVRESNHQIRLLDDNSLEMEEGYPSDVSSGSDDSESSDSDSKDGSPKRRKIDVRQMQNEYYRGSSYATPVAMLAYELATLLNKDSNDLLWLSLVGLTDHYVNDRMNHDEYNTITVEMTETVLNKNEPLRNKQMNEDCPVLMAEDGHIMFDEDFNFMLARHWNLYDSMAHSRYIATRLGIWKKRGREELKRFLAKMAIPLSEAKQSFRGMESRYKRKLKESLETHASRFGLENIKFGSFFRQYDHQRLKLSASDVVYAISALLENPHPHGEDKENPEAEVSWEENFWQAYQALSREHTDLLLNGVEICIDIQKNVVQRGCALIEKRQISHGFFRHTKMRAAPNDFYFTNPITLSKLGTFVCDALQNNKKNDKPYVICAEVKQRGTFLICGTYGREKITNRVRKNDFGTSFSQAARYSKANVKHDGFERSVVEVEASSVDSFLQILPSYYL